MALPYDIFPGLTVIGVVSSAVRELAITFNTSAIDALQQAPDDDVKWADLAGVTPAEFEGKIPIDLTALDGFEPFDGVRHYKQIEIIALRALVNPWQRNIEWDLRIERGSTQIKQVHNVANYSAAMVKHSRIMKARLAASILMGGTPGVAKAKVYDGNDIAGANKTLFAVDHLANPVDKGSRAFKNYHAAAGKFSTTTFAATRTNMRTIPSPTMSSETLGLQVTDIVGPSHMEEVFRQVQLAQLVLQTGTSGGTGVGAGVSNIYVSGTTPCTFHIAPQLDADPYLTAYKAANPTWEPSTLPHLWFAASRKLPGANAIEMVAPTREFTPRLQFFGDGSEMAAVTRKVRLLGDLDGGAAAGLPHVIARYEET